MTLVALDASPGDEHTAVVTTVSLVSYLDPQDRLIRTGTVYCGRRTYH